MLEVSNIDHITIAVKDLESAKKRFEGMFGGEPFREVVMEDLAVKAAFYQIGNMIIGLETPIGEGNMQRFLANRGEGIHHIALSVQNLNEAEQTLRDNGYNVIGPEVKSGVRTDLFVHPKSMFNIMLQLIEWNDPNHSTAKNGDIS